MPGSFRPETEDPATDNYEPGPTPDWKALRAEFPALANWTYLNTATYGQMPRRQCAGTWFGGTVLTLADEFPNQLYV